jgi:hypothetical protein
MNIYLCYHLFDKLQIHLNYGSFNVEIEFYYGLIFQKNFKKKYTRIFILNY